MRNGWSWWRGESGAGGRYVVVADAAMLEAMEAVMREGDVVVPLGGTVAVEAAVRGCAVADVWGAMDATGRTASLRQRVAETVAGWMSACEVMWEGVNVAGLVRYRHTRAIGRCVTHLEMMDAVADAYGPRGVLVVEDGKGDFFDRAAGVRNRPGLMGLIAGHARVKGWSLDVVRDGMQAESPDCARRDESALRAEHEDGFAVPQAVADPHVLMVGSGKEVSVLARFACTLDCPALVVGKAGDARFVDQGREYVTDERAYGAAIGVDEDSACVLEVDVDSTVERCLQRMVKAQICETLARNDGFRAHVSFVCGSYAQAMAKHARRWRAAMRGGLVTGVVSMYPHAAVDLAADEDVEAIVLPHGPMMVGADELYRGLKAGVRIGAVGSEHRAELMAMGIDAGRLAVTGALGSVFSERTLNEPKVREGGSGRVLLLTQELDDPVHVGGAVRSRWDREVGFLRAIGQAARDRGWRLGWRGHPRYDRDPAWYVSVFGEGVEVERVDGCSLEEAVAWSDVVVMGHAMSSALLDASGLERAVVIYDGAIVGHNRDEMMLGAWAGSGDLEEVVAMIDEAVRSAERHADLVRRTRGAAQQFRGHEADPEMLLTKLAIERMVGARA